MQSLDCKQYWEEIQTTSNEQHRKEQDSIQGQLGRTKLQSQVNWYGWGVLL